MKKNNKYLIVGLGNPSKKYEHTRHNVGFDCVDKIKQNLNITSQKNRFSSSLSVANIDDKKVFLMKPQTFMNNSGFAVKRVMFFYGIDIDNIIVIYDDMDIAKGKIRIRKKGSGGTHNGMKSIISHIRSYDFKRIRIGIGKPPVKRGTVDYVLGRATGTDKQEIDKAIEYAAEGAVSIITDGADKAMQEYNNN